MQLARVCGQVISTKKAEKLMGFKILVCQPIDMVTFKEKGAPFVSIDSVGAGDGELVMCVSGSSSRQTALTDARPVDNCIVAIIDSVDILGERCFDKADPSVMPKAAMEEEKAKKVDEAKKIEKPESIKEDVKASAKKENEPIEEKKPEIKQETALEKEKKPELQMTQTRPRQKKPSAKPAEAKTGTASSEKTKQEREAKRIVEDIVKKLEEKDAQSSSAKRAQSSRKKINENSNPSTKATNKPKDR